jgi:hypothetical protein
MERMEDIAKIMTMEQVDLIHYTGGIYELEWT